MKPVREWPIAQLSVHCIVYEMDGGESQSDLLRRLRSDARVESAQPLNSFVTLNQTEKTPYNDPYAGLRKQSRCDGRSASACMVARQRREYRGDRYRRGQLACRLCGQPYLCQQFHGQRLRPATHGTAVAGIIAATGGNHLGIVGIAPEADVHALAACWAAPSQSCASRLRQLHARHHPRQRHRIAKPSIVNLSLGGPSDPLLRRLIEHGLARNIIFVAALPGDQDCDWLSVGEFPAWSWSMPSGTTTPLAISCSHPALTCSHCSRRMVMTLSRAARWRRPMSQAASPSHCHIA